MRKNVPLPRCDICLAQYSIWKLTFFVSVDVVRNQIIEVFDFSSRFETDVYPISMVEMISKVSERNKTKAVYSNVKTIFFVFLYSIICENHMTREANFE